MNPRANQAWTRTICAIHQPNFFPWRGYFDKIARADVFIFLDDVAYPKSGRGMGSWVNRVRLNMQGAARWVGCPVKRRHGEQPIREVLIDDSQPWRAKLLRTLEINYRRHAKYEAAMSLFRPLIEQSEGAIAEFNMRAVRGISEALGLRSCFVRQSELSASGKATELLVNLVKAVGATAYLAGGGATAYQENELFARHGIELVQQNFQDLPYGPADRFLPGLSVIDYLMIEGMHSLTRRAS
jgi:hypothetical protein